MNEDKKAGLLYGSFCADSISWRALDLRHQRIGSKTWQSNWITKHPDRIRTILIRRRGTKGMWGISPCAF